MTIDGSSPVPAIAESFSLTKVDLGSLLSDVDDITVLSGPASIEMSVAGNGKSQRVIAASLSGKGSVHIDKGAIKGVHILGLSGSGDETDFDSFDTNFVITDGTLKNTDLKLVSSDLPVNGGGTVDLPQRQVVYRLTPKVIGLSVPVNIKGKWDDLNFQPDLLGPLKSLFGSGNP